MTLLRPSGSGDRRQLRILVAGLASAALLVGVVAPALAVAPTKTVTPGITPTPGVTSTPGIASGKITTAKVKVVTTSAKFAPVGTVKIGAPGVNEVKPIEMDQEGPKHGNFPEGRGASLTIPSVADSPITGGSTITAYSGATGWDAISGAEMRYATPSPTDTSRWNYSLEPPDQGLCVGNGYVMEAVNGAVQVWSTSGAAVTGVTPTNYFLGLPREFPDGPSVGDPRCLYDAATQRFFFSSYIIGGAYGTVLAVSNTSNPAGAWTVYLISDLGDGSLADCAGDCFPDYPQMGLDLNGVWITNNEFSDSNGYAGVTIIAMSKTWLLSHTGNPGGFFSLGYQPDGNPYAFTLEPAAAPNGVYDRAANGTQYFMATRDMDGTKDNVVDVWSVGNTAALNSATAVPWNPQRVQLTTQTYACQCAYGAMVGGAVQKYGPYPLGQGGFPPIAPGQALPRLSTNDDRMHNVVYANGRLWGTAATVMQVRGGSGATTGVAWWQVNVTGNSIPGHFAASVAGQGYIGARNTYLFFPSIGISGFNAVIAMTMSSSTRFPSVGFAPVASSGSGGGTVVTGAIRTAAVGVAPADGFTAYAPYSRDGTERWGDYSAAATDERGNVWFAAEYIGPKPRATLMNWGTWLGYFHP